MHETRQTQIQMPVQTNIDMQNNIINTNTHTYKCIMSGNTPNATTNSHTNKYIGATKYNTYKYKQNKVNIQCAEHTKYKYKYKYKYTTYNTTKRNTYKYKWV